MDPDQRVVVSAARRRMQDKKIAAQMAWQRARFRRARAQLAIDMAEILSYLTEKTLVPKRRRVSEKPETS